MKKFRVMVTTRSQDIVEVEAEDELDAEDKALDEIFDRRMYDEVDDVQVEELGSD